MQLIRQGRAAADTWIEVGEDAANGLPAGDIIVPLERLEDAAAVHRDGRIGVDIGNAADTGTLTRLIDRVDLIQIRFPAFADGRGFSLAKRLRNLGFAGTLRASGPLIADQGPFAEACGFDEIVVPPEHAERQPAAHFAETRGAFATAYQDGLERGAAKRSILAARHAGG